MLPIAIGSLWVEVKGSLLVLVDGVVWEFEREVETGMLGSRWPQLCSSMGLNEEKL